MEVDVNLSIDLRVPLGRPINELADFAARCESAGLHGIGIPDHHHTGRDAYIALTAMAMKTQRLSLYPATSNVVTRHALVLAALANSLDELAPGRAMITVAPGFLSVEKAGRAQANQAQLREAVLTLRGLLNDGRANHDDTDLHLLNKPPGGSRVVVLASGPRLLELAGEVADGVMMLVGLHPAAVDAAREHVHRGAIRAGRDPGELEETLIVPFGLGDTTAIRAWVQGWFREGQPWLHYPSRSNLRWLGHAGIELPADYRPEDITDDLADDILNAFGMFGSADACAERLQRAHEETGTDHVFLFPAHSWATTYELPREELQALETIIIPSLRNG